MVNIVFLSSFIIDHITEIARNFDFSRWPRLEAIKVDFQQNLRTFGSSFFQIFYEEVACHQCLYCRIIFLCLCRKRTSMIQALLMLLLLLVDVFVIVNVFWLFSGQSNNVISIIHSSNDHLLSRETHIINAISIITFFSKHDIHSVTLIQYMTFGERQCLAFYNHFRVSYSEFAFEIVPFRVYFMCISCVFHAFIFLLCICPHIPLFRQ